MKNKLYIILLTLMQLIVGILGFILFLRSIPIGGFLSGLMPLLMSILGFTTGFRNILEMKKK